MEQERIEAARRGETFFEGKECVKGHGTTRYVLSGQCRECQLEKARLSYRRIKERLFGARNEGAE